MGSDASKTSLENTKHNTKKIDQYKISQYGFFPSESLSELPKNFLQWQQIRQQISDLMREEKFVEYIDTKLNVIDCSETNLPEQYLFIASVYISHIAHAYAYSVRALTGVNSIIINFPDSIEIPWQQISERLKRSTPKQLFYDYASFNVLEKPVDKDLELIFSIFDTNTHKKFVVTFALTEKLIGMTVQPVYSIFSYYNDHKFLEHKLVQEQLSKMLDPLREATKMMRNLICTSRFDAENYVNPSLWTKTTATVFQSTRKGELGLSGGAAPVFRLLDTFFGRKKFQSSLGKQMLEKEYLPEHADFIEAVRESSQNMIKSILSDEKTKYLFYQASQLYYGSHGYLGIHQKKVFGFMLVGIASGRASTNSGTLKGASHEAVNNLDDDFTESNLERNLELQSGRALKVSVKYVRNFAQNAKQITFDMTGKLFKIWPGDKVAILAQNTFSAIEKCSFILHALYPDTDHYRKSFFKDYNKIWKEFIIKEGFIEESSAQSKVNFILRYGEILNLPNNKILQFKRLFNIDSGDCSSLFDILLTVKADSNILLPNLNSLLDVIDPINYRYYSICSSPEELEKSSELSILVGLLQYKEQTGLCSGYLHSLDFYSQSWVNVKIIYSYWSVPTHDPVLIVAGGTGISPMMSLLKHRISLGCYNNYVFFATTDKNQFYFENSFSQFVEKNFLSFFGTYTRSSKEELESNAIINSNMSIKELLESQSTLINDLLDKNVYIYTCGRTGFCKLTYNTIFQIMLKGEEAETDRNFAKIKLIEMRYQGRYVEEAFTSHNAMNSKEISILDVLSNDNYFVMGESVYDVSEFKKIHPGGDYLFLIASENEYKKVHDNDPIANNMLESIKLGHIFDQDEYAKSDIEQIKLFKYFIGKYYCATDIPYRSRTRSLFMEHQKNFVDDFKMLFKDSSIVLLRKIAQSFSETDYYHKSDWCPKDIKQKVVGNLWQKLEDYNFNFLFRIRGILVNSLRKIGRISDSIENEISPYDKGFMELFKNNQRLLASHRSSLTTKKNRYNE